MESFFAYAIIVLALVVAASYGYVKYLEFRDGDWDQRVVLIGEAVTAAEQMLGKEPGAKRLDWVMGYAQRRFPDLDLEDLRVLVEASVYRLKQGQVIETGEDNSLDFWVGSGPAH